jgi:hypothetical protein
MAWPVTDPNSRKKCKIFQRLCRVIPLLISQGLASFEGVGDALLGFAFAAEGDEGFAFEVEDVLLADELR